MYLWSILIFLSNDAKHVNNVKHSQLDEYGCRCNSSVSCAGSASITLCSWTYVPRWLCAILVVTQCDLPPMSGRWALTASYINSLYRPYISFSYCMFIHSFFNEWMASMASFVVPWPWHSAKNPWTPSTPLARHVFHEVRDLVRSERRQEATDALSSDPSSPRSPRSFGSRLSLEKRRQHG